MSPQDLEKNECSEFLEFIRYMLAIEPVSSNWDIKTDLQNNSMSIIIKSSKIFAKDEIEFIVDTIADYELCKFDVLRKLSWYSSSKILESSPGYLEFAWLNLAQKSEDSVIEKCFCQICLSRFDDQNGKNRS